jgi:hypothetical protein
MLKLIAALLILVECGNAVYRVPIRVQTRVNQLRGEDSRPGKFAHRQSILPEDLYNYFDSEFIGEVHVGKPPQHFEVLFSTGTSNFWITDDYCECGWGCGTWITCKILCKSHCCDTVSATQKNITKASYHPSTSTSAAVCAKKHKFISKESITYVANGKEWSINYPQGKASGILGTDWVEVGGLNIPSVTFGQATELDKGFTDDPLDGVFGLAYQKIAADNVEPVINKAIDLDLLADPIFT